MKNNIYKMFSFLKIIIAFKLLGLGDLTIWFVCLFICFIPYKMIISP